MVCIAAAQRRGLMDTSEAKRNGKDADNIAPGLPHLGPRAAHRGGHPGRPPGGVRRLRNGDAEEDAGGVAKKFLYVNRKAPYGTIYALESLEVVLIGAAFEQDVSLAFLGDGVYQLAKGQDTKALEVKNFSPTFRALEDYDVTKLYVEKEALEARGLTEADLVVPVQVVERRAHRRDHGSPGRDPELLRTRTMLHTVNKSPFEHTAPWRPA